MEQSAEIKELLLSLKSLQNVMPTMIKDKKGYGYNYTDLDTIVSTIRPLLQDHDLGFMQSLTMVNDNPAITTRIFHSSGQYIQDTISLPKMEMKGTTAAQNMGAAITYMRRYSLCAMLGITADEDIDGMDTSPAQSKKITKQDGVTESINLVHALYGKILSSQYEDGKLIYPISEKTSWLNTWECYTKQYGEQAGGTRALQELKKNFKDEKTGSDYPDA
jgi:hypothetical protein